MVPTFGNTDQGHMPHPQMIKGLFRYGAGNGGTACMDYTKIVTKVYTRALCLVLFFLEGSRCNYACEISLLFNM